mgnify:FL=1
MKVCEISFPLLFRNKQLDILFFATNFRVFSQSFSLYSSKKPIPLIGIGCKGSRLTRITQSCCDTINRDMNQLVLISRQFAASLAFN